MYRKKNLHAVVGAISQLFSLLFGFIIIGLNSSINEFKVENYKKKISALIIVYDMYRLMGEEGGGSGEWGNNSLKYFLLKNKKFIRCFSVEFLIQHYSHSEFSRFCLVLWLV